MLKPSEPSELFEDDLAVELMDEYDPLVPNNYELILRERREKREQEKEEEVRRKGEQVGCLVVHKVCPSLSLPEEEASP